LGLASTRREFTRLMGGLHWNPLVRIKAIAMRKDAIYYNLHMDRAKIGDYLNGKADEAGEAGDQQAVEALAQKILAAIGKEPLYYADIASASRLTISARWRVRSVACMPPKSSGRTRAGACACAARSSPPSHRGARLRQYRFSRDFKWLRFFGGE